MKLNIAIAGYGTAGQACALMLSRDGHDVEVFERAETPGPVGAGLLLQPSGLEVLRQLDLLDQVLAHGAPIRRLYGLNPAGRVVMDIPYRDLDPRLCGLGVQRGALFEILHAAWDGHSSLRSGQTVVGADPDEGFLQTADGRRHGPYDIIIAADGCSSALRAAHGRARLDRQYPWGALWCLVEARDWPHGEDVSQRYRGARKMVGLLPVGTRPGDPVKRLSFFWSMPVSEFGAVLSTDAFQGELRSLWPEAADVFERLPSPDRLARATYRDVMLRNWHTGRMVFVGDSAHAMSPQLGQGVNMALMDALALRDALRRSPKPEEAFGHYAKQRRRHTAIYHFWSRWLTPVFQSRHDCVAALRDLLFQPLGRLPLGRGHMLRVLTGTQQGLFGALPIAAELLDRLEARVRAASPTPIGAVDAAR